MWLSTFASLWCLKVAANQLCLLQFFASNALQFEGKHQNSWESAIATPFFWLPNGIQLSVSLKPIQTLESTLFSAYFKQNHVSKTSQQSWRGSTERFPQAQVREDRRKAWIQAQTFLNWSSISAREWARQLYPQTRDKEEAIALHRLIIPTITFSSCLHANLKSSLGEIDQFLHAS
jgi:hypothetical protein